MDPDLLAALGVIGAISPVGRLKIETKLRALSADHQRQIAALMRRADALAYFWQGSWVQVARAWLLIRMTGWFNARGYDPQPSDEADVQRWLGQLRTMAEAMVRQQLLDLVTARATLEALAAAQRNAERLAWDPATAFTNPSAHNPENFCYLVHAMRPTAALGKPSPETKPMHDYNLQHLGPYIDPQPDRNLTLRSAELYLTNPEMIKAEMLSCSLISNRHKKLYGNFSFGLILRVPSENICMAAPRDLAVGNSQARAAVLAMQETPLHRVMVVDDFLESLLGLYRQPLASPAQILARTAAAGHNEIVVLGFSGANTVGIAAIFIKVTSRNMLWRTFVAEDERYGLRQHILRCAGRLNVPIVPIQDDNPDCAASDISFAAWLTGPRPAPPSPRPATKSDAPPVRASHSLQVGNAVSVEHMPDRIREYDMIQIRQDAQGMLARGMRPDQVHRELHDRGGLPHEVAERVLNLLGYRNYI
jgi:hypothetical protein